MTGAGMSAESGIPTFRDALTGYWSRFDPAELASVQGFRANPDRVWRWYAERREGVRRALPNAGHLALAAFEQDHPGVLSLITQNVDDLHQRAGNAAVVRLHGDILDEFWLDTCARHQSGGLVVMAGRACSPPTCAEAATSVRPGSSGSVNPARLRAEPCRTAAAACSAMLVVGTPVPCGRQRGWRRGRGATVRR
jgi:NAD-dependent deacetylase